MDTRPRYDFKSFLLTFVMLNLLLIPGVCLGAVLGYIAWDLIGMIPGFLAGAAPALVVLLAQSFLNIPIYNDESKMRWLLGPMAAMIFIFAYGSVVLFPSPLRSIFTTDQARGLVVLGLIVVAIVSAVLRTPFARQKVGMGKPNEDG